jgi:hypothetical protein
MAIQTNDRRMSGSLSSEIRSNDDLQSNIEKTDPSVVEGFMTLETSGGAMKVCSIRSLSLKETLYLSGSIVVGGVLAVTGTALLVSGVAAIAIGALALFATAFLVIKHCLASREVHQEVVQTETSAAADLGRMCAKVRGEGVKLVADSKPGKSIIHTQTRKVVLAFKELERARKAYEPNAQSFASERRLAAAQNDVRTAMSELRSSFVVDIVSNGVAHAIKAIKNTGGVDGEIYFGNSKTNGMPLRFKILDLIMNESDEQVDGMGPSLHSNDFLEDSINEEIFRRFSKDMNEEGIDKAITNFNKNMKIASITPESKQGLLKKCQVLFRLMVKTTASDVINCYGLEMKSEHQTLIRVNSIVTKLMKLGVVNDGDEKNRFLSEIFGEISSQIKAAVAENKAKAKVLLINKYEIRTEILSNVLDCLDQLRVGYLYVERGITAQAAALESLLLAEEDLSVKTEFEKLNRASELNLEGGINFQSIGAKKQGEARAKIKMLQFSFNTNQSEIAKLTKELGVDEEIDVELTSQIDEMNKSLEKLSSYSRAEPPIAKPAPRVGVDAVPGILGLVHEEVASDPSGESFWSTPSDFVESAVPSQVVNRDQLSEDVTLNPTPLPPAPIPPRSARDLD